MFDRGGIAWIESDGGPLVLLDDRLRDRWAGTGEGDWEPGSGTDYDRACEVADWIGVKAVGDGEAVVLGSEPAPTAALDTPRGPLLLRWIHAPIDWEPPRRDDLLEQAWARSAAWGVRSATQVIQDAAYGGRETTTERLELRMPPGGYEILTAEYRPEPDVRMILHWLRAVGST